MRACSVRSQPCPDAAVRAMLCGTMKFDLENSTIPVLAARFYLFGWPSEKAPVLACDLLERGYDGRAIRILAGTQNPTERDVAPLLISVFRELGIEPMEPMDAALCLADEVCRRIVSGLVEPYKGAIFLSRDVASVVTAPWLDEFDVLVTLYEDSDEYKSEYAADIREAAREFLAMRARTFQLGHSESHPASGLPGHSGPGSKNWR